MVFVQSGRNPLPERSGSGAVTSGGSAATDTTNGKKGKEEKNGKESSSTLFYVFAATFVAVVFVIGGWITWANTHDATAVAQSYAFQRQPVTQSSTGIVDHTTVQLCYNFASPVPVPNATSISPNCSSLALGAYLEQLNIKIDNTSPNTYQEVTVCGMLLGQNDDGTGHRSEIARDNCVRFTHVGPGVTSESEIVGGQLYGSTHIVIIDYHGIATVNYHAITGRSKFCNTADAPPFCA
jgi:hypothetical protein